jgi:hypothetical protein
LSYAVVWREDGGQLRVGKLELGPAGVSVQGSSPDGTIARRTVSYTDVADVRIARGAAEQINGRPAVVVRQPGGRELSIGALEGPGVVVELGYALAELVSERGEGRACAVVVLPIRPRAAERIRRLIAEGPPFDPAAFGLDRHRVYLTEREAIFFFEGPDVARTAGSSLQSHLSGKQRRRGPVACPVSHASPSRSTRGSGGRFQDEPLPAEALDQS